MLLLCCCCCASWGKLFPVMVVSVASAWWGGFGVLVWRTSNQTTERSVWSVCLSVCVCARACMCRPSRPFARRGDRGQMRGDSNGSDTWGEMRLVPECDATQRNVPKGKLERRLRARLCANLRGARHLRREGEQAQAMNGRERDGEWAMTIGALLLMKGGGDRLLRPASNGGGPSQRQKTHAKGLLSVVTGGSLYWSGPTQSYLAGHLNCPALQVAGLSRSTNYTHTAHIYQRRSNGRKLIEVCQQAVPRIGLIVLNPTWRPPQQPTWNLRIRNSAIYQMCSRPREWQWPSEGSSSPSALLHAFCELLTTVGAKNKKPPKIPFGKR